jgi:ParB family transcriptional regulator, chromosome partitioning protein
MTTRRIDEIVVGERHRRDLGDIASLAANVAELGLLHPIVIHGTLIAGELRPNRAADLSRRHLAIRSPNRVRKGNPR